MAKSVATLVIDLQANVAQLSKDMGEVKRTVQQSSQDVQQSLGGVSENVSTLSTGLKALGGVVFGGAIISQARDIAVSVLSAQVQVDKLTAGLKLVNGGNLADVGRDMAFVSGLANKLGLELVTTEQAYVKLSAAARGTSLEGARTKEIFTAVAEASTVLGLSADETNGSLLAVSQMISKGKVQAEELRGQLGERLPGAFQIAARAMGVTTAELDKMLQQGELLASDFLPRFAAQLHKEMGGAAEDAANMTQASMNRVDNAWTSLKQNFAQSGAAKFLSEQMNILGDALKDVSGSMAHARSSGEGFTGQMVAAGGAILRFLNPMNALNYSVQDADAKIKSLTATMERLKQGKSDGGLFGGFVGGAERANRVAALQQEIDTLKQYAGQVDDSYDRKERALAASVKQEQEKQKESLSAWQSYYKEHSSKATQYAEAVAELNKKAMGAGISKDSKEYQEALKGITDKYKENNAEAKKLENQYDSLTKSIREKLAVAKLQLASDTKLTEGQKLQAKTLEDIRTGVLKLTPAQKANVETLLDQLVATEDVNVEVERNKKATEDQLNAQQTLRRELERGVQSLQEKVDASRTELEMLGLTKSQTEAVTLARMEEELAWREALGLIDEETNALARRIALQRELVDVLGDTEVRQKQIDMAKDIADAWKKNAEEISSSITDALMRGFESGKGFVQNLKDVAINAFKTMVLKPIISPLATAATNVVGNVASSIGSSIFGSAAGASLAASGGMAGLGGAFSAGMGLSLSQAEAASAAYSAAGMGMTGSAITAGAYFPPAMAAMAYTYIMDQALKGGWGGDNNKQGYALTWATGGLNVVGDKLFGHGNTNADASGISGTLTATGLQGGQSWQDFSQKGGTFSKDRRWTDRNAIDSDTGSLIGSQVIGLANTAKLVAKVMGENITDGIASWKHDFNLQLSENGDLSKASEKIAAEVGRAADSLALHLFPSLDQLSLKGETAGQTLTRLGATFDATNAAALMLGRDWETAFGSIGIASAAARQQLVDMSGGVDALRTKLGGYYENYFTDVEKNQRSLEMLDAQFAAMGVRLDLSKDAFKNFLEDPAKIDLTTEAGRKLYAGMLDLATPFSQLVEAMGDGAVGKQVGSLASLLGEKSSIAENVKQAAADWWSKYGTAVEKQADQAEQIKAGLDNMAASLKSLEATLLAAMQSAQQAALLSNQQSAAAAANAIEMAVNKMSGVVEGAIESVQRW